MRSKNMSGSIATAGSQLKNRLRPMVNMASSSGGSRLRKMPNKDWFSHALAELEVKPKHTKGLLVALASRSISGGDSAIQNGS
ncbi:hypothetical protein V6N13_081405 [Hibiscus sabdariffa]